MEGLQAIHRHNRERIARFRRSYLRFPHDSRVAIPMMKLTSRKVTSLYDLMDSAYDAGEIWDMSRSLGHVPIIDRNPRRGKALTMAPAEALRHHERTASERQMAGRKKSSGQDTSW
jgi:hypothetical protein